LGLPRGQRNERSALTLLALANLGPNSPWSKAEKPLLRIWDIMGFMRQNLGKDYAANSRETIRRQTIHQFEQARLVDRNPDDPSRPTNSGNNCYSLTDAALELVRTFGTRRFDRAVEQFVQRFGNLTTAYGRQRRLQRVKLRLPSGRAITLSPGKHNALQVAVIEEFGPRFAPGATVLYLGDTAKKHIVWERDTLAKLHINIGEHEKLPDVVLSDSTRGWLFLVEAVTTHGPVNQKRHAEMEAMLAQCSVARVYVTTFLTRSDFRRYAADIAWETEVWIAESPDHMIHFNGPKFLGPYPHAGD
jgi:hypothetical protein